MIQVQEAQVSKGLIRASINGCAPLVRDQVYRNGTVTNQIVFIHSQRDAGGAVFTFVGDVSQSLLNIAGRIVAPAVFFVFVDINVIAPLAIVAA